MREQSTKDGNQVAAHAAVLLGKQVCECKYFFTHTPPFYGR
jgi:hypothetical protein